MKVAWREVPEEPSGVDASPPRVLVVTSMYPSAATPSFGIFVKRQVEALKQRECGQEVLLIEGRQSRLNYLKAIWRVRRAVRSGRYDLVHAYYGLCGFVSAWQSSIPLVITYCGSDLNPGFAGRQRARLKSRVIIALGQIAALRASVCLVRSREMRGRLLGRRARDRARIVTSGVDLDLFQPGDPAEARRRLGWEGGKKVVLFVCSDEALPAVKRPGLASAVMERVKESIPDAVLEIVAGRPQETLPDFYRAADLLLLTSANEGSPNVVKEALACNLPVVGTRVGDVPELLAGLRNCHVCAPTSTDLAGKVIEVLRSGERTEARNEMAAYSLDRTSASVLDAYHAARSMPPGRSNLEMIEKESAR